MFEQLSVAHFIALAVLAMLLAVAYQLVSLRRE